MDKKNKKRKSPQCVGIIMDGNRRWAHLNGVSFGGGHKKGYETFKKCVSWAKTRGIKHIIFYAFSTENWRRSSVEISKLLSLFNSAFKNDLEELLKENVKIKFVGEIERFSKDTQVLIKEIEEKSKDNTDVMVYLAFSYGGRAEILHAVNTLIAEGRDKPINEEDFGGYLWTKDMPDPDLILRTGEVLRLSNFLPWQSVYSELFFSSTLWPDFDEDEFNYIIDEYENREKRLGK